MKVHKLKLRLSNAHLLIGQRPILVDTGSPGEASFDRSQALAFGPHAGAETDCKVPGGLTSRHGRSRPTGGIL